MSQADTDSRSQILRAFRGKPRTAGELAEKLGIPSRRVGMFLKHMEAAGLVRQCEEISGQRIWEVQQ